MAAARDHDVENTRTRERLGALVGRLDDGELARPMPGGWTVAAVLAHLAFWDQRVLAILEEWERRGASAPPRPLDEAAVDWINDAKKPLCLALAPRRAAELAVSVAGAVDGKVAALSDQLVAANVAAGNPVNLWRGQHRREHLDEIEAALR
jgi:uncharacterized damage-inducible protein DinB